MKKAGFLLIIAFLNCFSVIQCVQTTFSPSFLWYRTWGGSSRDGGFDVAVGNDGVYLVGYTASYGAGKDDMFLAKYNSSGNLLWDQIWGRTDQDEGSGVAVGSDGVYVVGTTLSPITNEYDVVLLKYNFAGDLVWEEIWEGVGEEIGRGIAVADDGIYITGETNLGALLIKYDYNGNMIWDVTYGSGTDEGCKVAVGIDGVYIVGRTSSLEDDDALIVKFDFNGNPIWQRTWGGPYWEGGRGVAVGSDGVYVVGTTQSFGVFPDSNVFVVKYDFEGNLIWDEIWGGTNSDYGNNAAVGIDGVYIVGRTSSFDAGIQKAFFAKYDSNGNMEWYEIIKDSYWGFGVAADNDELYVSGWTASDAFLVKYACTPKRLPATINIDPDTLNLKSNGQWITAYIELPEGYNVNDIDVDSILLNDTIPVDVEAPSSVGDYDLDSIPDLMVKFDRASIIEWLGTTDYSEDTGKSYLVTFTIRGSVLDMTFEGSDTVGALHK